MSDRISVVIPAFNEGATIARVVQEVRAYASDVIVVDDSSTDATGKEANAAGAFVLRHEQNKGYDTSIHDGMKEAIRRGADIIVTFDADGQHRAEDIPRLIAPLISKTTEISAGVRPAKAHIVESIFAWYTEKYYGVADPLCGFKAYRKEIFEQFGPFDTHKSIGTEMLLRAIKGGAKTVFIPIHIAPRKDVSRFYVHLIRGNLKILGAMLRVRANI